MANHIDTEAGIRLAYDTARGGDVALLFVHGWCGDRSQFTAQVAHFAPRYTAVCLDLRGHGQSGRPDPATARYDVAALAGDVSAVIGAAGVERPVVIGHSLGGLVALACAARPELVRAAVLLDPAPILDERVKAVFARAVSAAAADADGSWRRQFAGKLFRRYDVARREEVLAKIAGVPADIAAAGCEAIACFDGAAALRDVRVPLLVIHADRPEPGLGAAGPTAAFGQTVGSGHFLHLQVPDQVNAMIARFLATTEF